MKKTIIKAAAAVFLWAVCSFVALNVSGCAHINSNINNNIARHGQWTSAPNIVICPDGPVTVERVDTAIAFWEDIGYTFGDVRVITDYYRPCTTGNINDIPINTILIDIPSQQFNASRHVGWTRTGRYTETGEIVKAKIELMTFAGNAPNVLEHEIGHALGYPDINYTGHIMHGTWSAGGSITVGLITTPTTTN